MYGAWNELRSAALQSVDPLWNDFAKNGLESDVLAQLANYPKAARWLATSMSLSADCITRKLAAMLAGWVQQQNQTSILREMLERERALFRQDSLSANSVGEDIMFSGTRWSGSADSAIRGAGINILASMVEDALGSTPWNTAHWALANLYQATRGNHPIIARLTIFDDKQLSGNRFFQNAIKALKRKDINSLNQMVALPSEAQASSLNAADHQAIARLFNAIATAEASGSPPP